MKNGTIPKTLYRYRPLGRGTITREISALKKSEIWFSRFGQLNDPFEISDFEVTGNPERLASEVSSIIGIEHKGEFDRFYSAMAKHHAKGPLNKQSSSIACFSERWNNQPMWAHYSNNYNGFVVEYNTNYLIATSKVWGGRIYPVIYQDNRRVTESDLVSMFSKNAAQPFNTKHSSWEYEREWRLVRMNISGLLKHGPPAIRSIIVGINVSDKLKERLKLICAKNNWCYELQLIKGLNLTRNVINENISPKSIQVTLGERVVENRKTLLEKNFTNEDIDFCLDLLKKIPDCSEIYSLSSSDDEQNITGICTLTHNNSYKNVVIARVNLKTKTIRYR